MDPLKQLLYRSSEAFRSRLARFKTNAAKAAQLFQPSFPLTSKRSIFINILPPGSLFEANGRYRATYPVNEIHTNKYTFLTFVPKNLYEQFRRLANFYFLALVALQCIPLFEVASPFYAALPILFIVFVTAVKDGYEDWKRFQSDRTINNSECKRLGNHMNVNQNQIHPTLMVRSLRGVQRFFGTCWQIIRGHLDPTSPFDNYEPAETKQLPPPAPVVDKFNSSSALKPTWEKVLWKDIQVGDLILLENNQPVPADIVVLSSSEPDGLCYIETKNLDGETNLKIRKSVEETAEIQTEEDIVNVHLRIDAEPPHTNLYAFNGALSVIGKDKSQGPPIPVSINELLLRGCIIRNTKWLIGVVCYTGTQTKLILNSGDTPSKRSMIEKQMNPQVFANFLLTVALCLLISIGTVIVNSNLSTLNAPFVPENYIAKDKRDSFLFMGIYTFFVSLIMLQNIVPISLYVTTEFVKLIQAFFINQDIEMYYEPTDVRCVPKTWNIADDMGQIEYIFSDKTGTLTRNVMEFRKCSIGGVVYGGYQTDGDRQYPNLEFGKTPEEMMMQNLKQVYDNPYFSARPTFVDPNFANDLADKTKDQSNIIQEFFTHLAACHTVLADYPDEQNDFDIVYKAQSPDEAALVATAKDMGFIFTDRVSDKMSLNVLGKELTFTTLEFIEFNSTRKRMSVIVRTSEGQIILYTKGADSVIYARLAAGYDNLKASTLEHLELFAQDGLRTLCLAYKIISETDYQAWSAKYQEASASIDNREAKQNAVAELIERDLVLLGATAIEDRLQDGVPECIAKLARGGIKIWVLTGDKMETAINIGFSCNLLTRGMTLIIIKGTDKATVMAQLTEALEKCFDIGVETILRPSEANQDTKQFDAVNRTTSANTEATIVEPGSPCDGPSVYALVIDGASLKFALEDEIQGYLVELSTRCKAVICCRVSPLQKAQVVGLIKTRRKAMTLAIGDGANDVSMIQEANVGVGISGQEGMQAVMASDYAIGQFKYLNRLVLVHGRWSYFRAAEMTLLMFYKNMIWTICLFWFQIFCGFTGQLYWDYFFITLYNLVFTSLPPMILGFMDQDISDTMSLAFPPVYKVGIRKEFYGLGRFSLYMLDGCYQSLVCFFISYFIFYDSAPMANGHDASLMQIGTLAASLAVFNANIYMGFLMLHWTWISHFVVWGSIIVFYVVVMVYSTFQDSTLAGIVSELYSSPASWLALPISVVACLLPRYLVKFVNKLVRPRDVDLIREVVKYKSPEWAYYRKDADPDTLDDLKFMDAALVGSPTLVGEQAGAMEMGAMGSSNKSKITPIELAQRVSAGLDKYIADPLKKNFAKARSLLFMRTGTFRTNTGFAFSQDPGVADHMTKMASPSVGAERRMKQRPSSMNVQTGSKFKGAATDASATSPPYWSPNQSQTGVDEAATTSTSKGQK